MQRVKLANVLLESNDRFQDYPSLYCRTSKSVPFDESKGAFTLFPYEKFDFATFFNVFSNKKWRRYTVVDNVHVHLELCGDCEVSFIEIRETLAKPKRIRLGAERIASQEFKTIEFEFNNENAELLSFEIVTYGLCLFRNGYYYSQVNEADVRPVELALATTTFRQEQFIIPNIELIKSRILESDEVMNAHFHLHVVDNGRTLDAEGAFRAVGDGASEQKCWRGGRLYSWNHRGASPARYRSHSCFADGR